jgi:hypothetical protein
MANIYFLKLAPIHLVNQQTLSAHTMCKVLCQMLRDGGG